MENHEDDRLEIQGLEKLSLKDRAHIINFAINRKASIYFKHQSSQVFKANLIGWHSKKLVYCLRPENLPLTLNNSQVTLNFVIDQEIYFVVSVLTLDPKYIYFSLDTDMFHLARRKNRRLKIPKDYEAVLMIKRVGGQMSFLRALVLDISKGGCRLGLNTEHPLVCLDDILEGSLKLGDRQPVDVKGSVRYHKMVADDNYKQKFGVQFVDLSEFADHRVSFLVTDIQREFLLRAME